MDLKFDTLDKKPKLWDLIPVSILFAAMEAFLILKDAAKYDFAVSVLQVILLTYVLVRLIIAFFRQIRYNPYSYNTIYYFGFSVFTFFVILEYCVLIYYIAISEESYNSVSVLSYLVNAADGFMLLTFPFLFIFSAALCISNISLLRHEGKRFVNVLGIILAVLIVGGGVLIYAFDYYATGSEFQVMMHDIFANTLSAIYLYFECMILGVIVADAIAAKHEPRYDKDYVIILGCSMQKDGKPTPLLRGRIDRAIEFAKKQKEETGKDLIFVTSGGKGPNEPISESECMKRYLLEQGIPEERILEEDKSTNTFENMKFSKEKILEISPSAKVAFSTTNYHVFRSGLYARRNKLRAVGMGAKTKWYFWPNAAVREFVGLLTAHKLKQAVIFTSLIVFHVALTLFIYLY